MVCCQIIVGFVYAVRTHDTENVIQRLMAAIVFVELYMRTLEQHSADPVGKFKDQTEQSDEVLVLDLLRIIQPSEQRAVFHV